MKILNETFNTQLEIRFTDQRSDEICANDLRVESEQDKYWKKKLFMWKNIGMCDVNDELEDLF